MKNLFAFGIEWLAEMQSGFYEWNLLNPDQIWVQNCFFCQHFHSPGIENALPLISICFQIGLKKKQPAHLIGIHRKRCCCCRPSNGLDAGNKSFLSRNRLVRRHPKIHGKTVRLIRLNETWLNWYKRKWAQPRRFFEKIMDVTWFLVANRNRQIKNGDNTLFQWSSRPSMVA